MAYNNRVDIHTLITNQNEIPPLNTRICPGIKGDILQARINAFMSCDKKFCSFIDPSDEILIPSIFDMAIEFLDNNPHINGVYTNSIMNFNNCNTILLKDHVWSKEYHSKTLLPIHQLVIVRTEKMKQACKDLRIYSNQTPEQLLYANITPWHFMNLNTYKWNRTNNSASGEQFANKQERLRVFEYIKSVINN